MEGLYLLYYYCVYEVYVGMREKNNADGLPRTKIKFASGSCTVKHF